MAESNLGTADISPDERCESYFLFHGEIFLSNRMRASMYLVALAYCFIGLSAITARFFRSMENVVKQTRKVVTIDPCTNAEVIEHEKVWNFTIADITLLAFGTSFPQISLATIDALRNLGQLNAGVPKAGELKKISDIGVWLVELFWSFWAYVWLYIILEVWTPNVITIWEALLTVLQFGLLLLHAYAQDKRLPYLSIPLARSERPEDWVPGNDMSNRSDNECDECFEILHVSEVEDRSIVDIFSIHSNNKAGKVYQNLPGKDMVESSTPIPSKKIIVENLHVFSIWRQQFLDAFMLESTETKKPNSFFLWTARIFWQSMLAPWRLLFALVPPYQIAHGWIAFISSLIFISGIAYVVTQLTDLISCVTGINPYVIAFTALASGTSWPDLVASKIAAERQVTADSAIANITCSNSVNIYIGIGVPWLIDTAYNFFMYQEPLYIKNAAGLSFSLIVFFVTSAGCIAVLVARRLVFGAELGGPRLWAWATAVFFMFLWIVFVVLSSLKVSGII